MGKVEIEAFLTHLAVSRRVSASTQNQAMSAILFLYHHVLEMEPEWLTEVVRAKPSRRVPVVLSRDEVKQLLAQLSGPQYLAADLMYGAGLRLMETRASPHGHEVTPTVFWQIASHGWVDTTLHPQSGTASTSLQQPIAREQDAVW